MNSLAKKFRIYYQKLIKKMYVLFNFNNSDNKNNSRERKKYSFERIY